MRPVVLRSIVATSLATFVGAAALAGAVVYGGLYDVAATTPHFQIVYDMLETSLHNSVRRQARSIVEPPLDDAARAARGALCFRTHCVACHGAPGVAPDAAGMSMRPVPGPLVDAARHWRPRELYWITRNGIRMTGMPAWRYQMSDDDLWAVSAFVRTLPGVSPTEWQRISAGLEGRQCDRPG
jgi:mono/diheme cytochrome c family protein